MWPSKEDYRKIKRALENWSQVTRDSMAHFQQGLKRPTTADEMAEKLIFVILVSGFRFLRVEEIFDSVIAALRTGAPVGDVFRNARKASAIERLWHERARLFKEIARIPVGDDRALVDYFGYKAGIAYLRGPAVRYHAARDLGANLPKPDIWMLRIAGLSLSRKPEFHDVFQMCNRLSRETKDKRATIDYVPWFAASDASGSMIADPALGLMPADLLKRWRTIVPGAGRHTRSRNTGQFCSARTNQTRTPGVAISTPSTGSLQPA